jgi:hypothetical protein
MQENPLFTSLWVETPSVALERFSLSLEEAKKDEVRL